ncbi:hypothetical protein ACWG8W_06020 [Citricoccus zhacaiensis]
MTNKKSRHTKALVAGAAAAALGLSVFVAGGVLSASDDAESPNPNPTASMSVVGPSAASSDRNERTQEEEAQRMRDELAAALTVALPEGTVAYPEIPTMQLSGVEGETCLADALPENLPTPVASAVAVASKGNGSHHVGAAAFASSDDASVFLAAQRVAFSECGSEVTDLPQTYEAETVHAMGFTDDVEEFVNELFTTSQTTVRPIAVDGAPLSESTSTTSHASSLFAGRSEAVVFYSSAMTIGKEAPETPVTLAVDAYEALDTVGS